MKTFNKAVVIMLIALIASLPIFQSSEIIIQAGGPNSSYSIEVTSINGNPPSSGPFSNPITLEGTASTTNFIGQPHNYYIEITWGDDSITSEVPIQKTVSPNGKDFDGTWEASHTYTQPGTFSITAKLYHVQPPGAGGTASATIVASDIVVSSSTTLSLSQSSPQPVGTSLTATSTVFPAYVTGEVDFQVRIPESTTWTTYDTKTLSLATATSEPYVLEHLGTYYFQAIYGGDANYQGSTSEQYSMEVIMRAQNEFTLTLEVNPADSGLITASPSKLTYNNGDKVYLIATANLGWSFSSWSTNVQSDASGDFVIFDNTDITITATFTQDQYTLTLNIVGEGSVSKNPDQATYVYGDVVALTPTADLGWTFAGFSANVIDGSVTITENTEVTATFTLKSYTIIASAGSGGSISPSGSVTVNYGDSQSFTITANVGYHISSVRVNGVHIGTPSSYTFANVDADQTIGVTFAINTYQITVIQRAHGTISPGTITVNYGSSRTFTITPDEGYHIQDVIVDGISRGPRNSWSFVNVNADHTITAVYAINQYTITASSGPNGVINPSGTITVNHGSSQTFSITPAKGYHVTNVLVDGSSVGAMTSYTFNNVVTNHEISVTFAVNQYTITVIQGAQGTISPGTSVVNYGDSKTFTITPNVGYNITDVKVDGASKGVLSSWTFTDIQADHNITATFAIKQYPVTVTATNGGSVNPSGTILVNHGSSQTFTINANPGSYIYSIAVNGTSVATTNSLTIPNITGATSVSVVFAVVIQPSEPVAVKTYTLTVIQSSNGQITPGTVTVNQGSSQTFTIISDIGYHIVDVLVDGVSKGAVTSWSLTNIKSDHTVAANFAIDTYIITATADANGVISPNGAITANYGDTLEFTIMPNANYQVVNVIVDGVSKGSITEYKFTEIVGNHTIEVEFGPVPISLWWILLVIILLALITMILLFGKRIKKKKNTQVS
jgi:hypothetical protein